MKTYKVTYKETLIHTFYVDANNKDEADDVFQAQVMHGELDFSDGAVDETMYIIEDTDESEWDKPDSDDEDYVPSAENGDYSPSDPWNAPGMKMSDFI